MLCAQFLTVISLTIRHLRLNPWSAIHFPGSSAITFTGQADVNFDAEVSLGPFSVTAKGGMGIAEANGALSSSANPMTITFGFNDTTTKYYLTTSSTANATAPNGMRKYGATAGKLSFYFISLWDSFSSRLYVSILTGGPFWTYASQAAMH